MALVSVLNVSRNQARYGYKVTNNMVVELTNKTYNKWYIVQEFCEADFYNIWRRIANGYFWGDSLRVEWSIWTWGL